ncbi:protein S100-A5-like [Epinephelus moara]|uniref:protein S100-A5-like n=1 Tax=Epinephelus moara TaxID=300413 RepID=UPI00214F15C9|nr:protein S100-A5-like [Epinephelus moara]
MSGLVNAVNQLQDTFNQRATQKDDMKVLTKKELAELLHKEFDTGDTKQAEIDEFYKKLDKDGDGVVTFKEYVMYVIAVTEIVDVMKK